MDPGLPPSKALGTAACTKEEHVHRGFREDFLEEAASAPPRRQDTAWAHRDEVQELLLAVERSVRWPPSEGVVPGRGRDWAPGHAGRTVVVKKAGKADGVRRPRD